MSRGKTNWTICAVAGLLAMSTVMTIAQAGDTSVIPADFSPQGPAPLKEDQGSEFLSGNGPFAGAIKAVVPHPTNPDTVWVGSVNGGIWRTHNATDPSPTWTHLTDHMPSLSIGDLALDPTFPSHLVLVAGIGHWSALSGTGGPLTGIMRTTDGGDNWSQLGDDLSGESLSGVAPRGDVIVVTSKKGLGGVWRSTDAGVHFTHLSGNVASGSGLPTGLAYALAGDPSDTHRLYVGIRGPDGGIYRSGNDGATWKALGGGNFGGAAIGDICANADNMKLSVHALDSSNVVYAVVDGVNPRVAGDPGGEIVGLFRSVDHGDHWTALDNPATSNGVGLHPGGQGGTHLSMVADPIFPTLVYLGGDHDETGSESGRLFRCDALAAAGLQCDVFTRQDTANNTAPHPDSRDMKFDANEDILEADDGGIYRRTNPRQAGFGDWSSIVGNLAVTEAHSVAYDHVAHIALCGTQDNGSGLQRKPDGLVWEAIAPFDGNIVAAVEGVVQGAPGSARYFGTHNLDTFTRARYDADNNVVDSVSPALIVAGTNGKSLRTVESLSLYVPIATNDFARSRLLIVNAAVYESMDGGESLTRLSGFTGTATRAIAYGSPGNLDILYVGSSDGLFLRTRGDGDLRLTAYPRAPVRIALDKEHEESVWVIGGDDSVQHTPDFGTTWNDVTGDLGDAGAKELHAIAFIRRSTGVIIVIVGASDGLYATNSTQLGRWGKLTGGLPNAVVYDLDYDIADDVLVIGTLGRSVWKIPDVRKLNLPPVVHAGPAGVTREGSSFASSGSFSDPDGDPGEVYTATVRYGDGTGRDALPLESDKTFVLNHVYADKGTYTVTVAVTDSHGAVGIDTTTVTVRPGHLQLPGDCNQDGKVDISDARCLLGFLFIGSPMRLPCGDGTRGDPANRELVNWNGDARTDLSDAVALLGWLFLGGPRHVLGSDCRTISGCEDACTSP